MDDSPLVSPNIKEYMDKHKLEDNLNYAVNELLLELPEDPYSFLCAIFKSKSSSIFKINRINLKRIFLNDFKNFLCLEINMSYKGNTRKCMEYVMTINSKFFENFPHMIDLIIGTYEREYAHSVNNFTIEKHSAFDKILQEKYEDVIISNQTDPNLRSIGKILSNAISLAIYASQSIMQEIPLKNYVFNDLCDVFQIDKEKIPNLAFCIFKCGKTMNSKIKYERFMLILNNSQKLKSSELSEIISKMYASIKKVLTSGKHGESGMRLNSEGSYFPPNDSLNDVIKILEDIIKDTGESNKLSIGIDCNSNNYFNETTKKYEMDGFKQPPEADALIDYYIKFCNEHPAISYLEDPIADSDVTGWQKVFTKFVSKPNVIISTKNLVSENLKNLKNLSQVKEIHEINELMSEEEKSRKNYENNAFNEENAKKILFKNISFRLNEVVTISELFDCIKYMKNDLTTALNCSPGFFIWDNSVDSDQSFVVDIGLGLRSNMIVLHSINNRIERVNKINRYLELIEELY